MDQNQYRIHPMQTRDFLTIIFKHKKLILAVFLTVFTLVTVFAFMMKPGGSEAKARILFKFGREYLTRPATGTDSARPQIPPETIIRSEIEILTSRDVIEKVINTMGIDTIYPGLSQMKENKMKNIDRAVAWFLDALRVTQISGTSMIEISFGHGDSQIAIKVVNLLIDVFKEKHLEVFSSGNPTSFLENKRGSYQQKLTEAEDKLLSYKQKYNVYSFDEQRTALIQQQTGIDTALKTVQGQVRELEQKLSYMTSPQWSAEMLPEFRTQLLALQQREREVNEKYTENSRFVQSIRMEIQALRKNMEDARRIETNRVKGELFALQAREGALKKQLAQITGEIQSLGSRENELRELRRAVTQREESYQAYSRSLETSLIQDDMDQQKMLNISTVQSAALSFSPKNILKRKIILIPLGFFGGLLFGLVLAFAIEMMSPYMLTPQSAERRLGLTVLTSVTMKQNL